jgi:hypothetical protein
MGLISEIRKLEYKHIWLCISVFLGTVSPGFLIIFHFKPELIATCDIFKLLVFSLALALPLLPVNSVAIAFLYDRLPNDYENETAKNVDITRGALGLNAAVLYFSLLVCYFWSLNFKHLFWLVVGLEIFLLFSAVFVRHSLKPPRNN